MLHLIDFSLQNGIQAPVPHVIGHQPSSGQIRDEGRLDVHRGAVATVQEPYSETEKG